LTPLAAPLWQNLTVTMLHRLNFRLIFITLLLAGLATLQVAREDRPATLGPGLRLRAYVANTGDGTVSVVDLVNLVSIATVQVGNSPSGMNVLPEQREVWGVSGDDSEGSVWVLSAPDGKVSARIRVGPAPSSVEFSPDRRRAYVAASGANAIVAIDTATKRIVGRAKTGRHPVNVRVTPDGRALLVPDRDDATLQIFDAATLRPLASVSVAPGPEQVVVLPDSSVAFVSGNANQISAVDLQRNVLLANIELGGKPSHLVLKPDGGELYVTVPESHGIEIINTWTLEIADSMLVGLAPTAGTLNAAGDLLYVSDSAAGRLLPIAISTRRLQTPIPAGRRPSVSRLDPSEELLLVANEDSNDLAIIRSRTSSLLTLVPVGSRPSDLVVLLF
jgi:YVTN family beta-propeller protein